MWGPTWLVNTTSVVRDLIYKHSRTEQHGQPSNRGRKTSFFIFVYPFSIQDSSKRAQPTDLKLFLTVSLTLLTISTRTDYQWHFFNSFISCEINTSLILRYDIWKPTWINEYVKIVHSVWTGWRILFILIRINNRFVDHIRCGVRQNVNIYHVWR